MKTRVPIPRSAPSPPSCWASVWRGWSPFGVVFTKFHAFTWRGNHGAVEEWALNCHGNVVHAFEFAPAFTNQFSSLSGETTVLAHSLGNMVVCSAIQDHGFRPDRYFMLNAAVPAEAFDATQWNTNAINNPFEFEDWVGHPANSWASCWHTLFPTNDIRGKLTWKGRFAEVPQLTTLNNYYSTGDEVLHIFDTPDSDRYHLVMERCKRQANRAKRMRDRLLETAS